ncbi:S-adenosyl-L-methionine-dependent methyltransferase [Catenaria anguillulae PL171]|uniref:S-adenosyl-L-methionine-dependent methyltransferase n=1 Tax=Catenaria anguillulae PL171 TaxID=765915 RepID=A0A1Y2HPG8_9FUNG|nr:S-adenosyl-L-methionine-dependent methyltransferase [Catenaria anguillulae PL171]
MLPTPDTPHLANPPFQDSVYEPAEDTYLFLDALELDLDRILRPLNPAICLEIGSGSGCVTTFLAMHLHTPTLYLTTDINPLATLATLKTSQINPTSAPAVQPILTDLTSGLLPRLSHSIDILLFNPPYVPTPDAHVGTPDISAAWAGGERGRRVIDRVLPQMDAVLSDKGVAYMVLVDENDPDEIEARVRREFGMRMVKVNQRRAGRERLRVVRFEREPEPEPDPLGTGQHMTST